MVETKSGYPFVEGKYGIPFKDLQADSSGVVMGGSGRFLHYDIGSNSIEIEDEEFSGHHMYVKVSENTFMATVFTRRYITGRRHPDLFARKFIIFAYEYFLAKGHEISTYSSYWMPSIDKFSSENYEQYSKLLMQGLCPEDAARSTWTGKRAAELGFSEVESISEDKSEGLSVVFKRPDQD